MIFRIYPTGRMKFIAIPYHFIYRKIRSLALMERMQLLGTGIEILNYPTEIVQMPDGVSESQITEEAYSIVKERMNFLRMQRGKFISGCTEIDNSLSEAISSFFFKTNSDPMKREQFHNFIVDTPIFSFNHRKKVLQKIMETNPDDFPLFSRSARQEMFDQIIHLIKIRNAFAHGMIIINFRDQRESLSYYDSSSNRITELHLTTELFSQLYKTTDELVLKIIDCVPSE